VPTWRFQPRQDRPAVPRLDLDAHRRGTACSALARKCPLEPDRTTPTLGATRAGSTVPQLARIAPEGVSGDVTELHIRDDHAVGWVISSEDPGSLWIADAGGVRRLWSRTGPSWVTTARDGTALRSYATLPKGGDGPWPGVLLVHGGPFGVRDHARAGVMAHRLAEQGYAVVQVDYRGSGGQGFDFQAAGLGELASGMLDDLEDTVAEEERRTLVQAGRWAIVGSSYGGYAALASWRRGGPFQCAVARDAPVAFLGPLRTRASPRPEVEGLLWNTRRERRDAGLLGSVAALKTPVLLIQDTADTLVPPAGADAFATEAALAGVPLTYLRVPRGTHHGGTLAHEDAVANWVRVFLARCRQPSAGVAVQPSSLDVVIDLAFGGLGAP
jgi:dienelactone hydrolase